MNLNEIKHVQEEETKQNYSKFPTIQQKVPEKKVAEENKAAQRQANAANFLQKQPQIQLKMPLIEEKPIINRPISAQQSPLNPPLKIKPAIYSPANRETPQQKPSNEKKNFPLNNEQNNKKPSTPSIQEKKPSFHEKPSTPSNNEKKITDNQKPIQNLNKNDKKIINEKPIISIIPDDNKKKINDQKNLAIVPDKKFEDINLKKNSDKANKNDKKIENEKNLVIANKIDKKPINNEKNAPANNARNLLTPNFKEKKPPINKKNIIDKEKKPKTPNIIPKKQEVLKRGFSQESNKEEKKKINQTKPPLPLDKPSDKNKNIVEIKKVEKKPEIPQVFPRKVSVYY